MRFIPEVPNGAPSGQHHGIQCMLAWSIICCWRSRGDEESGLTATSAKAARWPAKWRGQQVRQFAQHPKMSAAASEEAAIGEPSDVSSFQVSPKALPCVDEHFAYASVAFVLACANVECWLHEFLHLVHVVFCAPCTSASSDSCGSAMYHVAKQAQSSFIKTMTERGFLHS